MIKKIKDFIVFFWLNRNDLGLAYAKKKNPVYSVIIEEKEFISGLMMKSCVFCFINKKIEELGVPVIKKTEKHFGSIIFVSDQYVEIIFSHISFFIRKEIIVTIYYVFNGKRQQFVVSSIGTAELAAKRIQPNAVYSMRFHRRIRASNSIRPYGTAFKSEIRFLRDSGDWWLNPLTDIGSPDIQKSHIELAGLPATTEVTFPIDIVYTWVDGSDPRWLARKEAALRALGRDVPEHSADRSRWEDRDELRYSLRSVALYAPWIRRIYLVTDDQVPTWLRRDGSITVVDHRDLFPAGSTLPTFNSHAIEAVLHRIEGLSEHFLYMNDDFFFGGVVAPENFFSPGGVSRIFLSPSSMPVGDPAGRSIASEWGGMNASGLLEGEFGRVVRQKSRHTPMSLRVSVLREIEELFSRAFVNVRSSQFRGPGDIAPVSGLYPHYALVTGRAVTSGIRYGYFDLNSKSSLKRLRSVVRGAGVQVFCLNDTSSVATPVHEQLENEEVLKNFLSGMYPWKSPWEI